MIFNNQIVPTYQFISGITNAQQAVVTFTSSHYFQPGEIVSFRVAPPYGMVEINNLQANILAIGSYSITVDIDTTFFTAFSYPHTEGSPPTCVPVGSGILPDINMTFYYILNDAFDNIQVPNDNSNP